MTEPSKAERVARWLVPLALILFAVAAIYISTTFKKMPPILKRGIQPSDFPQLICGLIIFLSLLMAWFDPVRLSERMSRQTWVTFAALWGERRPHLLALVGVGIPVGIFLLFDLVFRIRFPRGVLTNLWYG